MPTDATDALTSRAVSRRSVLKGALGALALFTIDVSPLTRTQNAYAAPDWINGWVRIDAGNTVTVGFCAGELGQGIMTGLAQWVAEELKVDWCQVRTELVPPGRPLAVSNGADIGYGTGGSKGMMNRYGHMRKAGMECRLRLEAASGGVAAGGGMLRMPDGGLRPYSDFAAAATSMTITMPAPFDPPYVQPADFRIVGKGTDVVRRVDIASKTNGTAVYGLDVRLPGMVFAVVKNCPTWTGTLAATKVPAAPAGTLKVVPLKPWMAVDSRWTSTDTATSPSYGTPMMLGSAFNAVAVVASNTWIAKQAASALAVSWTIPTSASSLSSSTMLSQAKTLITSTTLTTTGTATAPPQLLTAEKVGDAVAAFTAAPVKVDQYYSLPALPHVMMEVPNATVRVNADGTAECWVSTQNPPSARTTVAKVLGIPVTSVTVYPQLCGGGFGRRIDTDFIAQAAQVAQAMPGQPVMLVWPREEDLGHDQPRPAVYARARLGYDPASGLTAFNVRNVSQSPGYQRNPFKLTNGVRMPSADNVEGAKNSVYKRVTSNILVDHVLQNSDPATSTPTGYWRSVGASSMCFVVESAMDELALAAGADPFAFRRALLGASSAPEDVRMLKVMDAAKARIESQPLPAGSKRGWAVSEAFGSKAAVAVEVTKWPTDLTMRVTRVAVAVDPGFAVNPDQIRAQMEGGVVHGISSALWGQLVWSSGKASSRNFSNTRVLRMRETPSVEIDVLPSGQLADIGGTGEVPVPLMAPAMANAWFQLTGTRVRSLPFYPGATMSG